jgi:tight adherence protein B
VSGGLQVRRVALAVVALVALLNVPLSSAAAVTVDGTLSGTTIDGDVLTTSLSLPAAAAGSAIDGSSVVATLAGHSVAVKDVSVSASPRTVVLLVDTSGSMRSGGLDGAKAAARLLVQQLPRSVRLGVVSFSDQSRVLVRPTTDRAAALRAIGRLTAKGETSLYDGVITAVKAAGTSGDRRVLLLSDGGDTVSSATLANAVRSLAVGVTLDAVAYRTDESQRAALKALAGAGHGRVVNATTANALAGAFADTAREIASQVQLRVRIPAGLSGSAPLVVTAAIGNDTVTARSVVALVGGGPAKDSVGESGLPTRLLHPPVLVSTPWPLIGVAFALVLLSVLLLAAPLFESNSSKRTRQLELYSLRGRQVQALPTAGPSTGVVMEAAQGLVQRSGHEAAAGLRLDRAGMALRPAEWLVLQATVAVGLAVLLVLLGGSVWWGIPGGLVGVLATEAYVRLKVRRRLRAFERQLPDVLTLVASSLSTGFSLHQSLDAVAQDAADPVSTELYRALAETRIGAELTDALDRLAGRMDSENMRWTTMAIRIQQQVGGNLGETLRTTATTLREREQLRRMVRGLSAEGRLSAYILIGLPIGLFGYMLLTNHDYVAQLWTTALGWLMLAVAFVGMVVGSFWMSRVVKVEV